ASGTQDPSSSSASAAAAGAGADNTNVCSWHGCSERLTSETQALEHVAHHVSGADACRWRNCNRIPAAPSGGDGASAGNSVETVRRWLQRHVLIHGPFYKTSEKEKEGEIKSKDGHSPDNSNSNNTSNNNASAADTVSDPDMVRLANQIRDEKTSALSRISPLFSGGTVPQSDQKAQQQVMRLVLQGVGMVEQLQKWADRRTGSRGIQDRIRIWRCADEVLERVAYVAAQNTIVAPYASRLLAVVSQPSPHSSSSSSSSST
ncbi:hypothetical protein GGI11_006700, partial [Coemansia sp. RSA 2049]